MFRVGKVVYLANQDAKLVQAIKDADKVCSALEVVQALNEAYELYLKLLNANIDINEANSTLDLVIKYANNPDRLKHLNININEAQARQRVAAAEQEFKTLQNSVETLKKEHSAIESDQDPRKLLLRIKIAKFNALIRVNKELEDDAQSRVAAVKLTQDQRRARERKESDNFNRNVGIGVSGLAGGVAGFFAGDYMVYNYGVMSTAKVNCLMLASTVGGIVLFLLLFYLAYCLSRNNETPLPQLQTLNP
jgi:hypothetical protein